MTLLCAKPSDAALHLRHREAALQDYFLHVASDEQGAATMVAAQDKRWESTRRAAFALPAGEARQGEVALAMNGSRKSLEAANGKGFAVVDASAVRFF